MRYYKINSTEYPGQSIHVTNKVMRVAKRGELLTLKELSKLTRRDVLATREDSDTHLSLVDINPRNTYKSNGTRYEIPYYAKSPHLDFIFKGGFVDEAPNGIMTTYFYNADRTICVRFQHCFGRGSSREYFGAVSLIDVNTRQVGYAGSNVQFKDEAAFRVWMYNVMR